MMDVSATIEEYLEALLALKERQGDIRRFYLFHGPSLQDKSCIDDNIQCCRTFWRAPTTASPWTFWPPRLSGQGAHPRHLQPQGRPFGTSSTTPNRCARAEVSAMKRLYLIGGPMGVAKPPSAKS